MLTMEQVYSIKKLIEKVFLRKIAKITGHDFKTIKKYIEKEVSNS
ncbi:hypothetical protein [Anoxybacter fermentans]|nr:hypothetical protein [Anoxybacter fermentans]